MLLIVWIRIEKYFVIVQIEYFFRELELIRVRSVDHNDILIDLVIHELLNLIEAYHL